MQTPVGANAEDMGMGYRQRYEPKVGAVEKFDTDYETICVVEFLYRNLLCGIPVRENRFLTSVTGDFNFYDKGIEEMEFGGELYFQYQMTYETELFGENIKLPALCGMFNTAVREIEKQKNGKVRMEFKDKDPSDPTYTAALCFRDEESLRAFIEKAGGNAAKVLKNAKLIRDYL